MKYLSNKIESNIRIEEDPNVRPLFRAMARRNINDLDNQMGALRQDYFESVRNRQLFKKYRKYKGFRARAYGLKPTYNPWASMPNIFWRNDRSISEMDENTWDN